MAVISDEIKRKYIKDRADMDTALFVMSYDEPVPSKVLVVGAHDEPTANMLCEMGNEVAGVDLRPYDERLPPCNYDFIQGDFCDPEILAGWKGSFDVFVSLSTIEHFGMGAYREGQHHRHYDVIAMRKAWELLKVGGRAYVTVPTGGQFMEIWPHWRIYDLDSIRDRLIQDFKPLTVYSATAADIMIDNRVIKMGDVLTQEDVNTYSGIPPHVSTLIVMEKVPVIRKVG